MLIDWVTVAAQVGNFLLLAWLLKRFLYQPILDAIDAREKKIATELANVADVRTQAEALRTEFVDKNNAFDQQRIKQMEQLNLYVDQQRAELFEKIRCEAQGLKTSFKNSLMIEQNSVKRLLSQQVEQEVMQIAKSVLTELSNTDLNLAMVTMFNNRLQGLDAQETTLFMATLAGNKSPIMVRSAFSIDSTMQTTVTKVINDKFKVKRQIEFITVPSLICGIEMSHHGQKISWSIAQYLDSLSDIIDQILNETDNPESIKTIKKNISHTEKASVNDR